MSQQKLRLFTARYGAFRPSMGFPVRTTVGADRNFQYDHAHAKLVSPDWNLVQYGIHGGTEEEYARRYRARLNRHGVDAIRDELEFIADEVGCGDLVLLCFDNLGQPGGWCHRTMFAEWWKAQTDEEVPELAEPRLPQLF